MARERVVVPRERVGVLASVPAWVHVDDRRVEPADLVEQAMTHLLRDAMSLGDAHLAVDGDRHRRLERVAEPAQAQAIDGLDLGHRGGDRLDLLRLRLARNPKSRTAIACREIGWLFSEGKPDPTV
jgi:hypothetical protein